MAKNSGQIIQNERVAMMMVARDIMGMMFHRYVQAPGEFGAAMQERELNPEEKGLYNSALKYLTKEFNIGHRELPVGTDVRDDEVPPGGKVREPKPA